MSGRVAPEGTCSVQLGETFSSAAGTDAVAEAAGGVDPDAMGGACGAASAGARAATATTTSARGRRFIVSPRPNPLGSSRKELTQWLDEGAIGAHHALVQCELPEERRPLG